MHLRPAVAGLLYHLTAVILYPDLGVVDERSTSFEVHPDAGEEI
jgi:hypothetical protein